MGERGLARNRRPDSREFQSRLGKRSTNLKVYPGAKVKEESSKGNETRAYLGMRYIELDRIRSLLVESGARNGSRVYDLRVIWSHLRRYEVCEAYENVESVKERGRVSANSLTVVIPLRRCTAPTHHSPLTSRCLH